MEIWKQLFTIAFNAMLLFTIFNKIFFFYENLTKIYAQKHLKDLFFAFLIRFSLTKYYFLQN